MRYCYENLYLLQETYPKEVVKLFKNQSDNNGKILDYSFMQDKRTYSFKIIYIKETNQYFAIEPSTEETKLGEGQSQVYLGINLKTGEQVAVKIQEQTAFRDLVNEEANLKSDFLGSIQENKEYYIVMKLCPGEGLLNYLYKTDPKKDKGSKEYYIEKKNLPFSKKLELTKNAISELKRIHTEQKLLHRDVKTANYQNNPIGERLRTTLIDLGDAIGIDVKSKTMVGTKGYIPPEYLLGFKDRPDYSTLCDIWALGVVLAEIWTNCNYQNYLLDLEWDTVISPDIVKKGIHDVFFQDLMFDNEDEKKDWEIIKEVILCFMKDIPTERLSLEDALEKVGPLHGERVKAQIEQTYPIQDTNEYGVRKLEKSPRRRNRPLEKHDNPMEAKKTYEEYRSEPLRTRAKSQGATQIQKPIQNNQTNPLNLPLLFLTNDLISSSPCRPNTAREKTSEKLYSSDSLERCKTELHLPRTLPQHGTRSLRELQETRKKSKGAQSNRSIVSTSELEVSSELQPTMEIKRTRSISFGPCKTIKPHNIEKQNILSTSAQEFALPAIFVETCQSKRKSLDLSLFKAINSVNSEKQQNSEEENFGTIDLPLHSQ